MKPDRKLLFAAAVLAAAACAFGVRAAIGFDDETARLLPQHTIDKQPALRS